jgi:hypothetical protein
MVWFGLAVMVILVVVIMSTSAACNHSEGFFWFHKNESILYEKEVSFDPSTTKTPKKGSHLRAIKHALFFSYQRWNFAWVWKRNLTKPQQSLSFQKYLTHV